MLIELLSLTSEIPKEDLLGISKTASRKYKRYAIGKRDGGERLIYHPSRELKAIQRWIIKAVFEHLPIHESATAYKKGLGVKFNAEKHRLTNYTNRYDFSNFFPSFESDKLDIFLRNNFENIKHNDGLLNLSLSDEDIEFIKNIVCRYGKLTIGAPSSPIITNVMMYDFDEKVSAFCRDKNLVYTRYADDIFISSYKPKELQNLERIIVKSQREVPHLKLRMNNKKTRYLSRKSLRKITGVVITPDRKLSIGRERKRELRSLINRWVKGDLLPFEKHYTRGWLAFASDVEPSVVKSLVNKYGQETIDAVMRQEILSSINTEVEF